MLTKLFDTVIADPSIAPYVEPFMDFIEPLSFFFGIALAALCLLMGLFGQRMFGFIRWALVFVVGFVAGAGLLAPIVQKFAPAINALMVGLAVGLILAVLSRFIYNVVFVAVIGFDTYNICYSALFIPALESFSKGDMVKSIAVAVICVIIALILRKYLEMIVTAGIGGIGLAFAIDTKLFTYTNFLPLDATLCAIIFGSVITLVMLVYQFKNRIRF